LPYDRRYVHRSQPESTPEKQDALLESHASAFKMTRRYPAHEDPERVIDPDEE
jgi:hypothetical protein